jgi:glycosyltransferase involved in cell wall biosynthesis
MPRGLFVEPFYGGSHRAFLDGLVRHSRHEFALLTLPEGEWRRRMRRGAQELAAASSTLSGDFDFLVATDMLDLPAFLALSRPRFSSLPLLLYMHENQFTYPRLRGTKLNSWFGQVNYLAACVADGVAFNSDYHRVDFLGALRTLATQPNNWLIPESIDAIEAKSFVLPIGVELAWLDEHRADPDPGEPPLVLWNHRWEFDKAPEMFARVVERLADSVRFRLALAGDPGPNPHPALVQLGESLADRVVHTGYLASAADYARLLWRSDIIVSTTRHEFFGVGMVEALYAGCVPVAPNRFNYPALVPPELRATCLFETEAEFESKLRALLTGPLPDTTSLRASATRFAWPNVTPVWDAALDRLACGDFATDRVPAPN